MIGTKTTIATFYQTTNENLYQTYKQILKNILASPYKNTYQKGIAQELIGVHLEINLISQTLMLPSNRKMPKKLLFSEVFTYLNGKKLKSDYQTLGIKWWDYGFNNSEQELKETYPDYYPWFQFLKSTPSKNNVISLWENKWLLDRSTTSQTPCISQFNIQHITKNEFIFLVTQRSADANLGVPADFYQTHLIIQMLEKQWNKKCLKIIWDFNNIHIYENNILETQKWLDQWDLENQKYNFILNV